MRGRLSWNFEGGEIPLWVKILIGVAVLSTLGWNAPEIIEFIRGVTK